MTLRPCTSWPCPEFRPCPQHDRTDPEKERARNLKRSSSRAIYSSPRWQRTRTRHLRLEPWCRGYPTPHQIPTPATDVDHVLPIEDGGAPYDDENLQSLCSRCHGRKTADDVRARREAVAGGKGGRDRVRLAAPDRRGSLAHTSEGSGIVSPGPVGSLPKPSKRRRRQA